MNLLYLIPLYILFNAICLYILVSKNEKMELIKIIYLLTFPTSTISMPIYIIGHYDFSKINIIQKISNYINKGITIKNEKEILNPHLSSLLVNIIICIITLSFIFFLDSLFN